MAKIKLFVEGSASGSQQHDHKTLDIECRQAFHELLRGIGYTGKIIPCGGRSMAYRWFKAEYLQTNKPQTKKDAIPILLVDSEAPYNGQGTWQHVASRTGDGWQCPPGCTDDHLFLMVQTMEHWFLGDKEALARYYGTKFQPSRLPQNSEPERVSKDDLKRGLNAAAKDTPKAGYQKGRDSFKILATLNTNVVKAKFVELQRLEECLNKLRA